MAAALHTTQPVRLSHSPVVVERVAASAVGSPPHAKQHDRRRAALIAALVAAYLLAPDAMKRLARLVYAARVAAYVASYTAQARSAGASPPDDWQPSDTTLAALAAAAHAAAQSVAATYRDELTNAATRAVDDWLAKHADEAAASGVPRDLAQDVKAWADQRAQWKSAQVGQYETAQAAHQGAQDAAQDVTDGTLTDDSGAPIDTSQLRIAVLPADSSGDYCANYAGRVFAFDDAPSLDFPAHIGCQHFTQVLGPDGSEVDI